MLSRFGKVVLVLVVIGVCVFVPASGLIHMGNGAASQSRMCGIIRESWQLEYGAQLEQVPAAGAKIVLGSLEETGMEDFVKALGDMGLRGLHVGSNGSDFERVADLTFSKAEEEKFLDALHIFDSYDFFANTPVPDLAPVLLFRYPNSKLILTWRDFKEWVGPYAQRHPPGFVPFAHVFAVGDELRMAIQPEGKDDEPLKKNRKILKMSSRIDEGNWQLYMAQMLLLECISDRILLVDSRRNAAFCRDISNTLETFVGSTYPAKPFPGC
mmetsp:Transcript_19888/g.55889  ORF Transcript_19888/g.55889 Transcript_19888/m.55889 type:complete len:269 (+) Transcript_19888:161-967(+)